MFLMISCGGDNKSKTETGTLGGECYGNKSCNEGLVCDEKKNICVKDSENQDDDSDTSSEQNDDKTDTASVSDADSADSESDNDDTNPDDADSASDSGDSQPDNDADSGDDGDSIPDQDADSGDTIDEELNPLNLPVCSKTSGTPCIYTGLLIWSAKSPEQKQWIDSVDYCDNLKEGGFEDWRLPDLNLLGTLVQNCDSDGSGCEGNSDGKYSVFGDTAFFWSSYTVDSSRAGGVYFYDASFLAKNVDETSDVRCVRIETTSRKAECSEIPEHAVYNTVSEITLTWDWKNYWTPSSKTAYNENPSTMECRFKCKKNYLYDADSGKCLNPCDPNPCGESATCTAVKATQHVCCDNGYFWNFAVSKCMKNPCQQNSCDIPNSTGECAPSSVAIPEEYTCKCKKNYYWRGKEKGCTETPIPIGNICTAQNRCYNNDGITITCPASSTADLYGQDAYYAAHGTCIHQNFSSGTGAQTGTVIDNNTGLIWEHSPSEEEYTWDDAPNHCAELNSTNYGGINTWRIPNPLEFMTIVDNSKYNPATNSNFMNMPSNYTNFWTSKEYKLYNYNYAYIFSPSDGGLNYAGPKSKTYKILCVSGDEMQPATSDNFTTQTISGKDVVTDSRTGLMWQKEYVTDKTWQDALKYCEDSTYAGYSDWRLPNKNELVSLVNYDKPEKPLSYFPGMPSAVFESSSAYFVLSHYVWVVNFTNGDSGFGATGTSSNVRCVR